jgi:hypothetical protein
MQVRRVVSGPCLMSLVPPRRAAEALSVPMRSTRQPPWLTDRMVDYTMMGSERSVPCRAVGRTGPGAKQNRRDTTMPGMRLTAVNAGPLHPGKKSWLHLRTPA